MSDARRNEQRGARSPDGRTARRDRNRDAVLDAALELFAEDASEPSAAQIAERAGVSLRSVHRYFDDMSALARAAIERNLERSAPLFALADDTDGDTRQRVERLVRARLALYEEMAPLMRATRRRAGTNPVLAERLALAQEHLRSQVEHVVGPELATMPTPARRDIAAALDVLLGFDSFEHLRRVRRMGRDAAIRTLVRATLALVAPANAG
jgi:AcrR family transcriptional regulator